MSKKAVVSRRSYEILKRKLAAARSDTLVAWKAYMGAAVENQKLAREIGVLRRDGKVDAETEIKNFIERIKEVMDKTIKKDA